MVGAKRRLAQPLTGSFDVRGSAGRRLTKSVERSETRPCLSISECWPRGQLLLGLPGPSPFFKGYTAPGALSSRPVGAGRLLQSPANFDPNLFRHRASLARRETTRQRGWRRRVLAGMKGAAPLRGCSPSCCSAQRRGGLRLGDREQLGLVTAGVIEPTDAAFVDASSGVPVSLVLAGICASWTVLAPLWPVSARRALMEAADPLRSSGWSPMCLGDGLVLTLPGVQTLPRGCSSVVALDRRRR